MQVGSAYAGIFSSTLQHIQSCLDSIQYESAKVGFVTFNHSATFYSVPDDLSQENVKRTVCIDAENPFCVLSEGDLYLSIKEDRDKIDFLINHLQQISEAVLAVQNPKKPALPVSLDIVIASVTESMAQSGGKVLLFGVTIPSAGKSVLKQSVADDGKKGKNKFESTVVLADLGRVLHPPCTPVQAEPSLLRPVVVRQDAPRRADSSVAVAADGRHFQLLPRVLRLRVETVQAAILRRSSTRSIAVSPDTPSTK